MLRVVADLGAVLLPAGCPEGSHGPHAAAARIPHLAGCRPTFLLHVNLVNQGPEAAMAVGSVVNLEGNPPALLDGAHSGAAAARTAALACAAAALACAAALAAAVAAAAAGAVRRRQVPFYQPNFRLPTADALVRLVLPVELENIRVQDGEVSLAWAGWGTVWR